MATPYRSGVPIDSIAPLTDADDSPAQIHRKKAFQSLVGSIGWLSSTTRGPTSLRPTSSYHLTRANHRPMWLSG